MAGWIGVDFDGTLAHYDGWKHTGHAGAPVERMKLRVTEWLRAGKEVRIFTARIYPLAWVRVGEKLLDDWTRHEGPLLDPTMSLERMVNARRAAQTVHQFCIENFAEPLMITCVKDFGMHELWDDRAVQVIPNTGMRADGTF